MGLFMKEFWNALNGEFQETSIFALNPLNDNSIEIYHH